MDIDDILASVDSRAVPQETQDLHELTRSWVTERSAPEILPWPAALLDRVLDCVRKQVMRLGVPALPLNAGADISTTYPKIELVEDETGDPDPKANFRLIIIQTELERFKFLVRSFLRTRIAKVCMTIHHTL